MIQIRKRGSNKGQRLIRKYYLHLLRAPGTPHNNALAIGLGLFSACIVPVGHILIVLCLAIIFRTNKLLAILTTFVINPYTAPIVYPIFCFVGAKVADIDLTFTQINQSIIMLFKNATWHHITSIGNKLIFSYLIGGLIFGIIFGIIGYIATYTIIMQYQRRKALRRKLFSKWRKKQHFK